MPQEFIPASEIASIVRQLKDGKTLLYPTDTIWGIGGDASNEEVIKAIYRIKRRPDSKSLVCLVDGMEMLERIATVTDEIRSYLHSSEKPTTIIYPSASEIHPAAKAENGSCAIRIANDPFCQEVIKALGGPLLSTSANISGTPSPHSYRDIPASLLQEVDIIAPHRRDEQMTTASRIILIEGNNITVIRE